MQDEFIIAPDTLPSTEHEATRAPTHAPSTRHGPPDSHRDNEVLVRVEGVSKIFCRDLKKSLLYGLKDSGRDLFSWGKKKERSTTHEEQKLRHGEFHAVKDVSFELRRGECLGLIGHNGAGKTTLLKMLNGLIKPDTGRIEMRGRIGALIALGAGFNPILTGRENIYVNGSILGLTKKEIDAKIDEIIDFAEIGGFIDAPVQSYSSGMQVRLGFAVATAMEPDVLILDEVLAVGDAAFQAKCLLRISKMLDKAAVIFVSHQHHLVTRICARAIWLSNGISKEMGATNAVLHRYLHEQSLSQQRLPQMLVHDGTIRSVNIKLSRDAIVSGDSLEIHVNLSSVSRNFISAIYTIVVDEAGECVARSTLITNVEIAPESETNFSIIIDALWLRTARYRIDLLFHGKSEKVQIMNLQSAGYFLCKSSFVSLIPYQPSGRILRL